MNRRRFLAGSLIAGAALRARPALATGGLDTPSPSPSSAAGVPLVRVLLGSGQASRIDARTFSYSGKIYRGSYFVVEHNNQPVVVNAVPLEEYLYSVVPRESPRSWPSQTLQAQAILARTFALRRSNPNHPYDVVASQQDQAYSGIDAESASTTAAVDQTAGMVVRFNNALASISYMSCCGGHTEDAANIWGTDLPYLRGSSDPYCTASPDYRWKSDIAWASVMAAFRERLNVIGDVTNISIADIDSSGRARRIVVGGTNSSLEIPGIEFRRSLGPAVVRSLLIHDLKLNFPLDDHSGAIQPQPPMALTLEGSGRGHGVGLCQWGSCGMGRAGHSVRDILLFYFPGTEISSAYS